MFLFSIGCFFFDMKEGFLFCGPQMLRSLSSPFLVFLFQYLSLLPSKVLRLLEWMGFSGDRVGDEEQSHHFSL